MTVADQRLSGELAYSPDKDIVSAKIEGGEGNTKIATTVAFAKFSNQKFTSHKETVEIKQKVNKNVRHYAKPSRKNQISFLSNCRH